MELFHSHSSSRKGGVWIFRAILLLSITLSSFFLLVGLLRHVLYPITTDTVLLNSLFTYLTHYEGSLDSQFFTVLFFIYKLSNLFRFFSSLICCKFKYPWPKPKQKMFWNLISRQLLGQSQKYQEFSLDCENFSIFQLL